MTHSNLLLIEHPDWIPTAITHGIATLEGIQDTQQEFEEFLAELATQYPPERVIRLVVESKREEYRKTALLMQTLELANRDARVRGVSYKDRESCFTVKLKTGHKIATALRKQAEEIKKRKISVHQIVRPTDMALIKEKGFEHHLSTCNLFTCKTS